MVRTSRRRMVQAIVGVTLAGIIASLFALRANQIESNIASPSADQRIDTAMQYFRDQGLTTEQAAGITGNLLAESGLNPEATAVPNHAGFGIAMWSRDKWRQLSVWAKARHQDPYALTPQLEYLWQDLTTGPEPAVSQIRLASSVEDATLAFAQAYLKPSLPLLQPDGRPTQFLSQRYSLARDALS